MKNLASLMQVRLRRPDTGNKLAGLQILGRRGNIGKDGIGYTVAVLLPTRRKLNRALKQLLEFAEIRQLGETEAVLFLAKLPTATQARTLREILKVKKIREISDEERARLAGMIRRLHPRPRHLEAV